MKNLKGMMSSLALAVALTGCGGGGESKVVKVGVYGPFSGGSAPMGVSMRNGVRLAAEEINAAGGVKIGGETKKVELVERDDEAKNENGGKIMQEFLEKEGVAAVLGPINTGVANPASGKLNEKKVPGIINASAGAKVNELFAESPNGNYIFRIAASDFVQSEMVVREAIDVRKYKKPALLCDDTPYGQGGQSKMDSALARRGIRPVSVGKFKIKDTDMTAQLQEAKAAGADVLLVYGIGPELAAVSNTLSKLGWKVDVLGGWTLSMSNYINNAKENGNGTTMPVTFVEGDTTSERTRKFLTAYYAKYNEKPVSVAVAAAQGYDSMFLLKQALEQAGSTDGTKIKAALEDLAQPFTGLTGTYSKPFSATNHEAVKEEKVIMARVMNGVVVSNTMFKPASGTTDSTAAKLAAPAEPKAEPKAPDAKH